MTDTTRTGAEEAAQPLRVPFHRPAIGEAEVGAVASALRSGWLTRGPRTEEFERRFADYVGTRHAVAVSSATAALQLVLESFGIGPGDEVLVPTLTFASAATVVSHLGATPVLVDCDPDTLLISVDDMERRVTPRTRVLAPMHYGGQPCEMDRILELAAGREMRVLEDAAHALPAEDSGRRIGSISEATCFSFYATKTLTTGEGGMVTTDSRRIAARVRLMSGLGMSRNVWSRDGQPRPWHYEVEAAGYKNNFTDTAASLGLRQLARVEEMWSARHAIAQRYDERFRDVEALKVPSVRSDVRHARHLYVVLLDPAQVRVGRDEVLRRLLSAGIGTSVHYMPLHLHPLYSRRHGYRPDDLPAATETYERLISLPIFPDMEAAQVDYVADVLSALLRELRR